MHQFLYRDVRNDEELAALQTELRAWEEETFAELEKCAATKSDVSWVRTPGSFPAAVFSDVFNNELARGGAG